MALQAMSEECQRSAGENNMNVQQSTGYHPLWLDTQHRREEGQIIVGILICGWII